MNNKKDLLWPNICSVPYFRGLLRAVEGKFYQDLILIDPVIDLGCGDGHFASISFNKKVDVGIDPWTSQLKYAVKTKAYHNVVCGDGSRIPFPVGYFNSVISNSVLEHINDIDSTISEVSRVLASGGLFVFCVPNHQFLSNLSISSCLDRIGLKPLGNAYRRFFNKISRHYHCDPPELWIERLEIHQIRIEKWWHYFSPNALHMLEWGHYLGLPSLITHYLFQRWILIPRRWNLGLIDRMLRPFYNEAVSRNDGSYTFFIARKI